MKGKPAWAEAASSGNTAANVKERSLISEWSLAQNQKLRPQAGVGKLKHAPPKQTGSSVRQAAGAYQRGGPALMSHFAEHFQNRVGSFLPTEVGGAL